MKHDPYVLIIEDDQFLTRAFEAKFARVGIAVRMVHDGEAALAELKRDGVPAIVLLDIMLPKTNGLDVLDAIRKSAHWKEVPVFVVSNLGQQEDINAAKKKGANEYFIKANTRIARIVAEVERYLKKTMNHEA